MKDIIVGIIKSRATQASTWSGLIVLAASLCGYTLAENSEAVVQVAEGVAAAVAIFLVARNA